MNEELEATQFHVSEYLDHLHIDSFNDYLPGSAKSDKTNS